MVLLEGACVRGDSHSGGQGVPTGCPYRAAASWSPQPLTPLCSHQGMLSAVPGQVCSHGDISGSFLFPLWDSTAQNAAWIMVLFGNSAGV